MLFLLLGIFIAGIPLGIVSIVHSARTKGVYRIILLPLSIIALLLTLVALFGSMSKEDIKNFWFFYLSGLISSIVTLSVAVHYKRKQNNKVFDDKRKEHQESVSKILNEERKEMAYILEIKELKNLLDSGAITQEEYETKKTEILNRK